MLLLFCGLFRCLYSCKSQITSPFLFTTCGRVRWPTALPLGAIRSIAAICWACNRKRDDTWKFSQQTNSNKTLKLSILFSFAYVLTNSFGRSSNILCVKFPMPWDMKNRWIGTLLLNGTHTVVFDQCWSVAKNHRHSVTLVYRLMHHCSSSPLTILSSCANAYNFCQ